MKAKALQQAVYNQLNDSSITDLLSDAYAPMMAIFSDVPQAVEGEDEEYFPFITMGPQTISAFDEKDNVGGNAVVQINIWDRSNSELAIKEIGDAVDARLRRNSLSISGATHITTELESAEVSDDPDGKTKRMLILYRILWLT